MKTAVCDDVSLEAAASLLNAGGVVAIPTDTVYGIAAHPGFPGAEARLYEIKGREAGKKIALLAADAAAVGRIAGALPAKAKELAEKYWPGALTMVLGDEAFRVPDHAWTRRLLDACGGVLRVTSANLSGEPPATCAAEIGAVGEKVDLVIDGGRSPGGIASTVVRILPDGGIGILRPGAIFRDGGLPECACQ